MMRFVWPLIIGIICLPVVLLATGVPLPWLTDSPGLRKPLPLPYGDQELAWINTTTNAVTWERFVSGLMQAQMSVPGLKVDDTNAFQDSTTAVPELVISMNGREGRLRVRWYKIRSDVTAADWIHALASRSPPPLAVVGGGSTDRAVDLARALARETSWKGDRPLLLITTATADKVASADDLPGELPTRGLVDVYDDRTFRFCFTNRQMADAVLDFVWQTPDLRPVSFVRQARQAVASSLAAIPAKPADSFRPRVFSVHWDDDPYSTDLHRQFTESAMNYAGGANGIEFHQWAVPFSIGGYLTANPDENRTAESLARQLREGPPQRSLLVLPTVTQPARRFLRAVTAAAPNAAQRLVVVTGDGIPVNAVYRDAEFAWPTNGVGIPTVLFTHNNPFGWDRPGRTPPPVGYELHPPNSTEDALHFRDLGRIVVEACYPPAENAGKYKLSGGLIARADDLQSRLKERTPAFFDNNGDRLGGTGEYVVVRGSGTERDAAERTQTLSAWRREPDGRWRFVRTVHLDSHSLGRVGDAP